MHEAIFEVSFQARFNLLSDEEIKRIDERCYLLFFKIRDDFLKLLCNGFVDRVRWSDGRAPK